ncbi:MAG: asparagine synthase C-terminal domain-containing protein [Promethearchaeota archaeon]
MEIIENQLRNIVEKQRNSVGLLYSGGLDSSIIAKILITLIPPSSVAVVSVGLPDSVDLNNATIGAKELGIKLHKCLLTQKLVLEAVETLKQMSIIYNPVDLSIAIPIFLGLQTLAHDFDVKTVFLGQGADEIFVGYQKYVQLYEMGDHEAVKKAMIFDLQKLQKSQIVREQKIAQYFGLDLIYPFLDPKIIEHAYSYSIQSHLAYMSQGNIVRKAQLRKLAKTIGLSDSLTNRPKKAIQYGSGTIKLLKNIAKSNNYQNIPEWFQSSFSPNLYRMKF